MMLMNAGHSFQPEETVLPEGGLLEGLQIFMCPSAPDLGSSAASVQVALRLIE